MDLMEAFNSRLLIRPSSSVANLVHLVRATGLLMGVRDLAPDDPIPAELASRIGDTQHLVFVLCDGLGMNLLRRMPPSAFLPSHFARQLNATCPSTTACALTSVATGQYPTRHAVTGWFTHVPPLDITVTMLPFAERYTKQSLTARGLRAEDLLPVPAFYSRMDAAALTLLPAQIINTAYAQYSRGYTPGIGYQSIPDAIDKIVEHVNSTAGRTYTHLYMPEVDTLCHHIGAEHHDVMPLVHRIDEQLARLHDALGSRARIVVSADHGLIDVTRANQTLLTDGDPILKLLACPPTGDARMPIFHVRQECRGDFVSVFLDRFGDIMFLLPTDEAERMRFFGPEDMSPIARPRFGDFIAIPFTPTTLAYAPPTKTPGVPYVGQHAGMSPQEMEIPLCIA